MKTTSERLVGCACLLVLSGCGANTADTSESEIQSRVVPPGQECANGGLQIEIGADTSGNGELEPGEITSTTLVCNETPNSLVVLTDEPPGQNCPTGGTVIETGPDTNGNGVLDPDEIARQDYVCAGVTDPSVPLDFDGVTFVGEGDLPEVNELFRASTDGTRVERIAGPRFEGGGVNNFVLSGDGRHVAFTLSHSGADTAQLYVSDLASGRAPVRVSGTMPETGGSIAEYVWSPDGTTLAFVARYQQFSSSSELWVVQADGTGAIRLSPDVVTNSSPSQVAWSPNGQRIAYRCDCESDDVIALFSVRRDGTNHRRVSQALGGNRDVDSYAWHPDGTRLIFQADAVGDGRRELFSATAVGADRTRISSAMGVDRTVSGWTMAPDGSHIAYASDEETNNVHELYVIDADGGNHTKVSGTVFTGVEGLMWSPDASRIMYRADEAIQARFQLHVVAADGTGHITLSSLGPQQNLGNTRIWSPDSTKVAYQVQGNSSDSVWIAATDGSGTTRVSSGDARGEIRWSPDGAWLAFFSDESTQSNEYDLFVVRANGNNVRQISFSLFGANTGLLAWSPNGERVTYVSDEITPGAYGIWSQSPQGNDPLLVTPGLAAGADIVSFSW